MALALTDDALAEVMAAAALVPVELRSRFLEAVAAELQAEPAIGPGNCHRMAHGIARRLVWDDERAVS